jgi:SAM-dependent methyltransferase
MTPSHLTLAQVVLCPNCHNTLIKRDNSLHCTGCNQVFSTNEFGYIELTVDKSTFALIPAPADYVSDQVENGDRVFEEFLLPYLRQEPFVRALDVGCGVGRGITRLNGMGYEAYGIDLSSMSNFWHAIGNSTEAFFCTDACKLPFRDNYFDVVYSFGVIEHIGTADGHAMLGGHYKEARLSYAREMLRVTKPGGRILISCPNKWFPIDLHHGYYEGARGYIFRKTGFNVHRTWGENHLLSYADARKLFCRPEGARSMHPLPLKNYFGFGKFKNGILKPFGRLARCYVDNLPTFLRATFANPYMFVEIRR